MRSPWYGWFKDLRRRTACDKIIPDKAFDVAKNQKHDEYKHGVASLAYKSFDKNSLAYKETGIHSESASDQQQLTEDLYKSITRKIYSSFR